ncbi:MAG: hypothetical protein MAG451_01794 [Anaerolineales bacterium]|nr:hypothetical protein [Anaerolineales bacterium]
MAYLPAWLILSLIITSLYGALFHLLWGRSVVGLLRVVVVASAGFLIGEAGARLAGSNALMMGEVHVGIASVAAWAGLAVAHWRIHESES